MKAALAVAAALGAAGCGAPEPPAGGPMIPAAVEAVLASRCSGCHGQVPGGPPPPVPTPAPVWTVDPAGSIPPAARAEALAALLPCLEGDSALDTALLRSPLGSGPGGRPHPRVFELRDDPDLGTLQAWVLARGAGSVPRTGPTSAAARFAREVVPVLARRGCFGANCHGTLAANELHLDPGLPGPGERFTAAIHAANREAALGRGRAMVDLAGEPCRARLVLKAIPLAEGGVLHKGGNELLSKADPDYAVLLGWIRAEAAEWRAAEGAGAGDRGLVFVRRPRASPERLFEDTTFLPGADLYWKVGERETNLTAALHPGGPADVRAPAVDRAGTRVAFAFRAGPGEPFDIWELDLDRGGARRLTFSPAPGIHFLDPIYVPSLVYEGREALVLVSNRDGGDCAVAPAWLAGEAEGGGIDFLYDRERTEADGLLVGRELRVLAGSGAGETRTIASQAGGRLGLDRPLPVPLDSTTRYALAREARQGPCFSAYRLEPGEAGGERAAFAAELARMTYTPTQIRRPGLLTSGEVVFTSLRQGDLGGIPAFHGALWRTHLDGSSFHPHGANRNPFPVVSDTAELVDGLEARIGRGLDSWWGGTLLLADHAFGPGIEPDNPFDRHDHPLDPIDRFYGNADHPFDPIRNPGSVPRYAAPWIALDPGATAAGRTGRAYRDPAPLPDGAFLVAASKGPVDLDDPAAAPDFDIYRVAPDPAWQAEQGFRREAPRPDSELGANRSRVVLPLAEQGFRAGRIRMEPVVAGPEAELWPRPVVRRRPPSLSPGLVRAEPVLLPGPEAGLLHILDLGLLESLFTDFSARGPRHVRGGVCPACGATHPPVAWLRVVAGVGTGPGGRPARVLAGEFPLHGDGSVAVVLPARTAARLQALDADGVKLSEFTQWVYLQPGELRELSIPGRIFPQACGPCHGSLTGEPADVLGRVDAVTRASRTMAKAARLMPPPPPVPPPGFEAGVRPVLAAGCASCHSGPASAAGLDLGGPGAAAALRGFDRGGEGDSGRSRLVARLRGREAGEPGRPGAPAVPGSHPAGVPLPPGAVAALARWIDMGYPP